MKKKNEGYALVLVLVMLTVLSLMSSVILAASLRNMRLQKTVAQRMCDEYAVEGQIRRITSQLEAISGSDAIDLNSDPETGTQILVIENIIVIRACSGQIQGDCVLVLEGSSGQASITEVVNDDKGTGVYRIEGLSNIRYAHYEIYTAEEVTADGNLPEQYTGTVPPDEPTEPTASSVTEE